MCSLVEQSLYTILVVVVESTTHVLIIDVNDDYY